MLSYNCNENILQKQSYFGGGWIKIWYYILYFLFITITGGWKLLASLLFSHSVLSESSSSWIAAHKASMSFTMSQSLLKLRYI